MAVILKSSSKLIKIILKVIKIHLILKLSAVLSALSRVHVSTILNFAPSPKQITFDAHVTAGYKQESLLEYLSGVTARTTLFERHLRRAILGLQRWPA